MANIFKPKRSSTSSSVPTTGDLTDGELAVNSADKIIYLRDGGSIVEVANYSTGTGGESYWVSNDVGIHTLSNVGIGSTQPTATLDVGGTLNVTGVSTFQDNVNVTGNLAVDTNTLFVNSTTNRIGIGTANPAYQVEIENTGANALLVLDRTDGAACFIEGQATRSAFGSVNATPLALAYNSAAVVLVGASGSITVNPDGDGFTFPTTDGSANQVLQTDGNGTLSFADSVTATEHKILDDISSSFNGSTTQFTISSSSTNFLNSEITTAARLLISVGGVVQQPDPTQTNGYYISGGTDLSTDPIKINFVEAPKTGQVFFGVAYGLTVSPTSAFTTAEQSIAYSITFGV